MSWTNVRLILAREIRDQLRDRRTMFMIVVLPILLYPLLGMAFLQIAQFMQETSTRVLVVGKESLPKDPPLIENGRFAERLFAAPEKADLLKLTLAGDRPTPDRAPGIPASVEMHQEAAAALQDGRFEAVLYIPPDFGTRLNLFREAIQHRAKQAAKRPLRHDAEWKTPLEVPKPEIFYTTATEKSQLTYARLSEVLRRWTEEVRRTNLEAAEVPQWATEPLGVAKTDVAAETGAGGAAAWSKVLPVLMLLWAMTGAFYPAVDLCAGEKERGTLETLLSSPAQRSEIVLGKLVTIMLFSILTAVLNIVSILIMGQVVMGQLPGFGPISPIGALWMALALIPASALFSALCLALATFARSTKEGQYYLMPLLLITLPLAVLPVASGMELNLGNSLIPVTGLVLLLRAALQGDALLALEFLPTVMLVTLAGCVLAIRWAVDQFNTESVLFRESERLDVGLWLRHLVHDRGPTPTAAGSVFCGVVILFVFFYANLAAPQYRDFGGFARVMLITQLAVVVAPTLLMTVMLTTSPRKTLLLRWPAWPTLLAAALLAVVAYPIVHVIYQVVLDLYPLRPELKQSLTQMSAILKGPPLWQVVLVFAALPAVCEELAFRGFILSGFRRLGHKWRAIIFSALFFALVHGIFQRVLVSWLLGVVIGLLAVQTGSILPGMVFHVVHNTLLVASTRLGTWIGEDRRVAGDFVVVGREGGIEFAWPVVVASAVLALAILAWFLRLPYRKSLEEKRRQRIAKGLQCSG